MNTTECKAIINDGDWWNWLDYDNMPESSKDELHDALDIALLAIRKCERLRIRLEEI